MIEKDFTWQDFFNLIDSYQIYQPVDRLFRDHLVDFVNKHDDAFVRSQLAGHVTASAFVVDEAFENMLLMHHKKLDFWVQFGGHADGDMNVLRVSRRELLEESGIDAIPFSENIFDIDIHRIPAVGEEPPHLHYDIRFLYRVSKDVLFNENFDEVNELKWFPVAELKHVDGSWLDRVQEKVVAVRDNNLLPNSR